MKFQNKYKHPWYSSLIPWTWFHQLVSTLVCNSQYTYWRLVQLISSWQRNTLNSLMAWSFFLISKTFWMQCPYLLSKVQYWVAPNVPVFPYYDAYMQTLNFFIYVRLGFENEWSECSICYCCERAYWSICRERIGTLVFMKCYFVSFIVFEVFRELDISRQIKRNQFRHTLFFASWIKSSTSKHSAKATFTGWFPLYLSHNLQAGAVV